MVCVVTVPRERQSRRMARKTRERCEVDHQAECVDAEAGECTGSMGPAWRWHGSGEVVVVMV